MSPPSASSESSSSKREELLNPSPPDTNPWKIKRFYFFFSPPPPFVLTKIELDSNELFPPLLFKRRLLVGKAKISFFHILEKNSISRRATVGSPLVHTFLVPTIFLLGKHIIFITLFGLVYFCFSCFSRKIL